MRGEGRGGEGWGRVGRGGKGWGRVGKGGEGKGRGKDQGEKGTGRHYLGTPMQWELEVKAFL